MINALLAGRTAIITGANQGLGLAIARAYVAAGASVALIARDQQLLDAACFDLKVNLAPSQRVTARRLDVADRLAVERVVAELVLELGRIDVLVNNAGIYGPMGRIEDVDWDAWQQAIEINLFGSVWMCRAILPHFRANGGGKIVQISGGGATNPMPRVSAYAASKAAIVRFAETLAEETRDAGIAVNCIAPGALNTRMLDKVIAAGPAAVGQAFYDKALRQKEQGGTSPAKGAELAVFLGSSASDGITGKLISAVWDPWPELSAHRSELHRSDIYTLRRIVPGDRGCAWGK
jgi:NAD(P)-dependent dehydrogenase (short-subunit alcohol dehydrogenase family)